MDTINKFLALPLSEQKRISQVARKVSRITRGIVFVDVVFTQLVETTYARRENERQDRMENERRRFA